MNDIVYLITPVYNSKKRIAAVRKLMHSMFINVLKGPVIILTELKTFNINQIKLNC